MERVLKRASAEINLNAIDHNFKAVKSVVNGGARLCCVIKADAYGHGAVRLAKEYERLGADFFGVSNLDEALQLRNNGIKTPILILGYTPVEEAKSLSKNNISQCVYSPIYAKRLSENAVKSGVKVKIHIKVDTGMNRLGFTFENADRDFDTLDKIIEACNLDGFYNEGIFTHFAVADEGSDGEEFTLQQYSCFIKMLDSLEKAGIRFDICHCANSAAVLDYPQIHMDMVRAGIIMYGLYPSPKIKNKTNLEPALSLKSIISHVKTIAKGSTVSYGRVYTAEKPIKVATVPIGYADGYPRIAASRGAQVLISGKRCNIVGRVCMDQLMVDVSELESINVTDEVILIGKSGSEEITADEIAGLEDSINYEVVCDIGKRVPRVYVKDGKVESVSSSILP